ncbi:MAG: HD domain-containing protein, partial [Nanoarchaeota archaeon]|nr:HD domain-containing protein [Nanoarchaeota archaeon]
EVVELGALLHDIGRVKFGGKDHDITGVPEAEKILRELNYPEETIEKVKHCVHTHRASVNRKAETIEAEIIRDADALSHFDALPLLARAGLRKYEDDVQKTTEWIYAKLQRDWNNKMHLPESKEMVKEKYKAAMLLLEAALGKNGSN